MPLAVDSKYGGVHKKRGKWGTPTPVKRADLSGRDLLTVHPAGKNALRVRSGSRPSTRPLPGFLPITWFTLVDLGQGGVKGCFKLVVYAFQGDCRPA